MYQEFSLATLLPWYRQISQLTLTLTRSSTKSVALLNFVRMRSASLRHVFLFDAIAIHLFLMIIHFSTAYFLPPLLFFFFLSFSLSHERY